jgi:hypothetical protein
MADHAAPGWWYRAVPAKAGTHSGVCNEFAVIVYLDIPG